MNMKYVTGNPAVDVVGTVEAAHCSTGDDYQTEILGIDIPR